MQITNVINSLKNMILINKTLKANIMHLFLSVLQTLLIIRNTRFLNRNKG